MTIYSYINIRDQRNQLTENAIADAQSFIQMSAPVILELSEWKLGTLIGDEVEAQGVQDILFIMEKNRDVVLIRQIDTQGKVFFSFNGSDVDYSSLRLKQEFINTVIEERLYATILQKEDGTTVYDVYYFPRDITSSPDGINPTVSDSLINMQFDYKSRLVSETAKIVRTNIFLSLLFIVIGVFLALVFSRRITTPLRLLTLDAQKISQGNFVSTTGITSNDEVGDLAHAFERMATEIRKSQKQLEKYNKELASKVRQRTKELEESNKLKDLFTDIIRHDIQTPLTVIKAMSQFVLAKYASLSDKKKKDHLTTMEHNATLIQAMINSAKKYATVEKKEKLPKESFDLRELISDACDLVSLEYRKKKVKLINEVTKSKKSIPIKANELLREVFLNLLTNALKYGYDGKKIIISLEEKTTFYLLRFTDFGPGIPDEYKKSIFTRLTRKERKGVKGTGLGLAIVKKIVTLHKGKIWVEDNPKGGAIFVVQLKKK